MRVTVTVMTLVVSGLIATTVQADIPEKYLTIVDRNSFGLNPPPPPATEAPPEIVPPANVKLTGFATIDGQKKAYFTIPPKDAAKEAQLYLGLGEGERSDILEVITISISEGEVRVKNSGVDMVLSLKNNGFKGTPAPAVTAAAGPAASPVYVPPTSPVAGASYQPVANFDSGAGQSYQPNNSQNASPPPAVYAYAAPPPRFDPVKDQMERELNRLIINPPANDRDLNPSSPNPSSPGGPVTPDLRPRNILTGKPIVYPPLP